MLMTGLKEFLREDGKLNDGLIEILQDSAEAELLASGVPEYTENDPEYPLYKICLFLMVSRDYDKRVLEDSEQRTLDKNILRIRKFPSSTEVGGE